MRYASGDCASHATGRFHHFVCTCRAITCLAAGTLRRYGQFATGSSCGQADRDSSR